MTTRDEYRNEALRRVTRADDLFDEHTRAGYDEARHRELCHLRQTAVVYALLVLSEPNL